MLSNFELEQIAEYYKVPLLGVVMKDELPPFVRDGSYIINLQSTTDGNGSHWTALQVKGNSAFFFDSFGAPPSTEIVEYTKQRSGCHIGFNNWIIQDLKSENCGYYALGLLIYINKNLKTSNLFKVGNDYIDGFTGDTKHNDKLLRSFYSENTEGTVPPLINRLLKQKK
jgi:hypothetical protein